MRAAKKGGVVSGAGEGSGLLLGPAFDLRPSSLGAVVKERARGGPVTMESVPPVPKVCVGVASPPVSSKEGGRVDTGLPSPVELREVSSGTQDKAQVREKQKQKMGLKPGDEMYAPFNVAFDTSMRYFEWLEKKENVFRLKRFGKAMTGTEKWEVPGSIIGVPRNLGRRKATWSSFSSLY